MINTRIGDAIDALERGDIDILAHGVNCCNGFGSGIAGQIAMRYPEVKKAFHSRKFELGDIQVVPIGPNKLIVNCATQQLCGGDPSSQPEGMYCSYAAIEQCMTKLDGFFGKDFKIGLPYIGAGLAGGEWKYIRGAILTKTFSTDSIVYTYKHYKNISISELKTIRTVVDYFDPTGFYSYHEHITDNGRWDRLISNLGYLRHVWFGEDYVDICKVRFYKDSTVGEVLSEFAEVLNKLKSQ